MNRSRLLPVRMMLFALLTATLLAACTQDELAEQGAALPEGKYPLELTTASLGEAVATPTTRATVDGTWAGNETVYAQIVSNKDANFTSENDIDWANVTPIQYTVSSEGEMTLNEPTELRYWQSTDETFYIRAWYAGTKGYEGIPVSDSSMTDADWQTNSTQNAETIAADDFLYAYKELTFADKVDNTLQFRHLLSKVTINLINTPYLNAYKDVHKQDKVSVSLFSNGGSSWDIEGIFRGKGSDFGLYDGTGLKTAEITPYKLTNHPVDDTYYATYEALVIPQDMSIGNKVIMIVVEKTIYMWTVQQLPDSESGLKGGQAYTFNITVDAKGLGVQVDTSIGWGADGANGSGSVTLP